MKHSLSSNGYLQVLVMDPELQTVLSLAAALILEALQRVSGRNVFRGLLGISLVKHRTESDLCRETFPCPWRKADSFQEVGLGPEGSSC